MAYSTVNKTSNNKNISDFMCDEELDLIRIPATCGVGSQAVIMSNDEENRVVFVKTPSTWVVRQGESDFEVPKNTLEIIPYKSFEKVFDEPVSKLIKNVRLTGTGNVVGTFYYATVEGFSSDEDEQEGYFFPFHIVGVPTDTVQTMSFYKNGEENKIDIPFDRDIIFKITKDVVWKVVLDNGQSITLYFQDATYKTTIK